MKNSRKKQDIQHNLSRRERQIMDAVFSLGKATAIEIVENIPDPPSRDAVRRQIRILEEKGYLKHEIDGPRHVYYPTVAREKARESAVDHLVNTYFKGSVSQAIASLIKNKSSDLSETEMEEITRLIIESRSEGR